MKREFKVYYTTVDPRWWDDGVKFCTATCEAEAQELLGGHGFQVSVLDGPLCEPPSRLIFDLDDCPLPDDVPGIRPLRTSSGHEQEMAANRREGA